MPAEQKQAQLLQVLVGLFDVLDQERGSVIAGLDRFGRTAKGTCGGASRGQREAADTAGGALRPIRQRCKQMTQQVKWAAEVFQDRRQALSYACDVPSKIEQRLFALAHQIQQELE